MFGFFRAWRLKRVWSTVRAVAQRESVYRGMTDADLGGQTEQFRKRLAAGETPHEVLPDAFAACREAGHRALGMRHYDVQLLAGMILCRGAVAEVANGEGKTLAVTLPAYLRALEGKGVHVITVNDDVARHDAEWMTPLYRALGLTVGVIQNSMSTLERQTAYSCDVTYGAAEEFGFDYLRDNMRAAARGDDRWPRESQQVQRALHCAILDEADHLLIDDARTPLIIAGPIQPAGMQQASMARQSQTRAQTLATITPTNFFGLYHSICGTTATAATDAAELWNLYKLQVTPVPRHTLLRRIDYPDRIFRTIWEKHRAILREIETHCGGRPVLVGTRSANDAELLSDMLAKRGIRNEVIHPPTEDRAAEILARAGRKGAVTIGVNLSGRTAHIALDDEVRTLGGLHVVGAKRNDSRRADLQLASLAGQQGDPGSSRFFLSLDDDLLRVFAGKWVKGVLTRLGMKEDQAMESRTLSRRIAEAQRKVEERNCDIRRRLLEYDAVLDVQTKWVYGFRQQVLDQADLTPCILEMLRDLRLRTQDDSVQHRAEEASKAAKERLAAHAPSSVRTMVLGALDAAWTGHLAAMDQLRSAVGQRLHASLDPKKEYQREAEQAFRSMWIGVWHRVMDLILGR